MMRNALVATAMLLAGVATVASAQDTTRAGQQADTTIRRDGQQAKADSAWKSNDPARDSIRMHGRDSLPKGEHKAQGEQDAVNPKLDAQGRPDSTGATGRDPTGTNSPGASVRTMEPTTTGATTGSGLAAADGYRRSELSLADWVSELRAAAADQKISQDPSVVPPGRTARSQAQPPAAGSTTSSTGSYTGNSPGEQGTTAQPAPRTSPDADTGRPETESSSTTGQQQDAANAPGNREGTDTRPTGTSTTPK
jgi:hypothetical protein